MKLSMKGRYGVRAMYELALTYGEGAQSVKAIAERQNIPQAYLEQVISPLRRAGLVNSIRGAQGGYELADTPCQTTVGAILRAVEGPLASTACVMEKCEHEGGCAMHVLWSRIHKGVNQMLDGITLQNMLDDVSSADHKCNCH